MGERSSPMEAALMGAAHGREFWAQLVAEVDGGEHQASVAKRHHVKHRTLTWWCWRLRSERRVQPRLLPVVLKPAVSAPDSVLEVVVGDVRIRVPVGADAEYVAALVGALRRC